MDSLASAVFTAGKPVSRIPLPLPCLLVSPVVLRLVTIVVLCPTHFEVSRLIAGRMCEAISTLHKFAGPLTVRTRTVSMCSDPYILLSNNVAYEDFIPVSFCGSKNQPTAKYIVRYPLHFLVGEVPHRFFEISACEFLSTSTRSHPRNVLKPFV